MIYQAFRSAFEAVGDPINLLMILLATVFGMVMGALPGIGGAITLALLIPLTFGFDALTAFMVLAAAKGGTNFGGSITAILLNTPGSGPNAATLLDGYPMARDGRAAEAIGASAVASAFGSILGLTALVLSIPFIIEFILLFGAPEIFWLGVWGITVIAVVVQGNITRGLISAGVGMLIAMHGVSLITATPRWTYNITLLRSGIRLVPALIGLFAVAEMLALIREGGTIEKSDENIEKFSGSTWKGMKGVFVHRYLFLRSSLVGLVVGSIPGVGGTAANYIAYFQASQTSKNPGNFGNGDIRGVIASESSNDAKDGGALFPTLGLGVPGSVSMAVLFGAFILHGITPGPRLFETNLDIIAMIIVAMVLSNIITSSIGLLGAKYIAKITKIDIHFLAPLIIAISYFGSFAVYTNIYYIFITLSFGILGYLIKAIDMSRVPLILAMVLTPIVEENFFRSLQISGNEWDVFVRSPIAIILIILTVLSLLLPQLRQMANRLEVFGEWEQ